VFETIGVPELLIIGVLVLILFGAGRLGKLGGDLGSSIKEFRKAMKEDEPEISLFPPAANAALPPAASSEPRAADEAPGRNLSIF
jgi:Sec-independent protein translocase protein TatE